MTLRYEAQGLTSFAGLELIGRFLRALGFKDFLYRVRGALPSSDFGSVPMVLLVLVMLITGARRVRHVGYVEGDPLVERSRWTRRRRHIGIRWRTPPRVPAF